MHRSLIRPRPLPEGGTIGVFTPSTPANVMFREKYQHGLGVLRSLGYRVVEGSLTARGVSQGYRSGTPEERAAEFMELVLDDSVHCLMSAIGGMNSSSMIPYLDFDLIRAHPKIICGYSDVTSLHLAVLAYSGLSTFYGPAVMPSFGEWPTVLPYMLDSFLDAAARHTEGGRVVEPPGQWSNHFRDAVGDAWRTEPREFRTNEGWRALRPGAVTAPIVGGNLDTLLIAAGTDYFPELEGTILMIEDVSGDLAAAERALRHLELMGAFDRIVGLVVSKSFSKSATEILGPVLARDPLVAFELGLSPVVHAFVADLEDKDVLTRDHVVRARRPPPRRRQAQHPRRDPHQAGRADARGVRARQAPHHRRRDDADGRADARLRRPHRPVAPRADGRPRISRRSRRP